MSDIAISIKGLYKKYSTKVKNGGKIAIEDLDFNVPKGCIFGLLGPNGAGKSTLINILAGTVIKDKGEIKIFDTDADQFPKKARSMMGIVPQEIYYDTFFPLYQALEFYAGYYGIKPESRKTEEILKALGLWDKRKNFPQQLSGGMKRRFLIAKSMVHSPPILILDEPTAGVDLDLRNQLWKYVKELNQQGITIIITTHYLAEAQELCDEFAFINHGKIVKQNSKRKLLDELGRRYVDVEFSDVIDFDKLKLPEYILFEKISDNKIRFNVNSEKSGYSNILKEINKIKHEIKDFQVYQPDLEDIFHEIIKQ